MKLFGFLLGAAHITALLYAGKFVLADPERLKATGTATRFALAVLLLFGAMAGLAGLAMVLVG